MSEIKVRIKRGSKDDTLYSEYTVKLDGVMSVMDVLRVIYREQDDTLAFFDHEACHQAACGRCLVKVNGRVVLACAETASGDMVLEPWNGEKVVRDLLCD